MLRSLSQTPHARRPDTRRVLALRSHLRAVLDGDERVFLLGDDERILLVGRAHARVAALIDGRRSVAVVLAELAGELHPAVAYEALATLEARGYLVPVAPAPALAVALRTLADSDGAALLREALGHAGVELADSAPTQVVVVADHLAPGLDAVGREALAAGATWWPVKLTGERPWIGPAFRPGGPCWACLAHRLRHNRPVESYLERRGRYIEPPSAGDPAVRRAAAAWAALTLRNELSNRPAAPPPTEPPFPSDTCTAGNAAFGPRVASLHHRLRDRSLAPSDTAGVFDHGGDPPAAPSSSARVLDPRATSSMLELVRDLPPAGSDRARIFDPRTASSGGEPVRESQATPSDRIRVLDPTGLRVTEHVVVRRPQCPACGDPTLYTRRASAPVVLAERLVNEGARALAAGETFRRHAHLVDPLTGAISSLGPVTGTGDLVWAASVFTHPDHAASFDDFHATAMGKGDTPEQARAGALGEAIERLSAAFQGDEPYRVASLRELTDAGERAVHPDALQLFSRAQLAGRDAWNARHPDVRRHVPLPFDPAARVAWIPAWSLDQSSQLSWLPAGYCYLAVPRELDRGFFQPSSNGHAVGNCLEEAILHGLLELVERDAVAIWWYGRVRRPAVALPAELVERLAARGWTAWALDLTHDLGIAVRAAVARDAHGRWCVGFGAHLDAAVALARATGELRQLLVIGDERWAWSAGELPDERFLYPAAEPAAPAASTPVRELRTAIEHTVALLRGAGLETLVVDQTRPDLGLAAAKVIVPGLRHFWPRFAPGRLYDVPLRLGWTHSLDEPDLNPVPLFL